MTCAAVVFNRSPAIPVENFHAIATVKLRSLRRLKEPLPRF
jgi:hypothetical protein